MRLIITYDRRTIYDKEFSETDHPRGQPENKGEFAKGSGGATAAKAKPPGTKAAAVKKPAIGAAKPGVAAPTKASALVQGGESRESWPDHIKALKIPPAWKSVRISHDPNASLLAVGVDAAGRRQAVYSKKFAESQSALKFSRIMNLMQEFGGIQKQNEMNRQSTDPVKREHADCTALIMDMGIRPGSDDDTKAKVKAYGATTLEGKHVVADKGQVFLRFTGKKGVALNLPVTDPGLAKSLLDRSKAAGPDGQLFGKITGASLLNYVHGFDGGGFKTKDFRTLLATKTANDMVTQISEPTDAKSYKKAVLQVAKAVSDKLGNTPTIALQSYINPVVFAPWRQHAPAT